MKTPKFDIKDCLFYLSIAIIILWAIFKATGLINTPLWVGMVPLISGAFGVGVFYNKVMDSMGRLKTVEKTTRKLCHDMIIVKNDMVIVKKDVETIEHKLGC